MTVLDLSRAQWHTSTHSSGNGNCVEVAGVDGRVAVRDSKDRPGPVLVFPRTSWRHFLAGVDALG